MTMLITALTRAIRAVEMAPLPDRVTQLGVALLVGRTSRKLAAQPSGEARFARDMAHFAIAEHTDQANEQHYELPPEFFELTLGPRRKYSCCLYRTGNETLAEAEVLALAETAEHAGLADGQTILELGCGWGSLTLYMAARYPRAQIVAVSNSAPQRRYIEAEAARAGLANVKVITADMNTFSIDTRFDRIVSVEMFEHMANWPALLTRLHGWLNDDGRLFLHVFAHRSQPYRFDSADRADWIAQHFFTGGIMPSHGLIARVADQFEVEQEWRWNGRHYQRTARDWLANFDTNRVRIDQILREVYGADAGLWGRRWRLFYLATAGLFGYAAGEEWAVSHYRLRRIAPTRIASV